MSSGSNPGMTRFVLVGAGATATALGPALRAAGYRPAGIVGRNADRALDLANAIKTRVVADLPEAELYLLCVPDVAIEGIAMRFARIDADWSNRTVLHLSGALGTRVLEPLAERGATTLAFHPVQTFVYPSDSSVLDGIAVGMTGSPDALRTGRKLAARLGLRPVEIREADRPLYHLATALVSNGMVTLSAMAHQILRDCGVDGIESRALLAPLIRASAQNLAAADPGSALTGPVVRGDAETVERHLAGLRATQPFLVPAVAALTTETVWLAVRSGRLDAEVADRILAVVSRYVSVEGGFTDEEEP